MITGDFKVSVVLEYGNHYEYIKDAWKDDKGHKNQFHWTAFVRTNSTEFNVRDLVDYVKFGLHPTCVENADLEEDEGLNKIVYFSNTDKNRVSAGDKRKEISYSQIGHC